MLIYFRTKFQAKHVKVILRTYLASDYMLYRAYILQFQSTLFCDIKYDLLIRLISNFGRLVQFVDFFLKSVVAKVEIMSCTKLICLVVFEMLHKMMISLCRRFSDMLSRNNYELHPRLTIMP